MAVFGEVTHCSSCIFVSLADISGRKQRANFYAVASPKITPTDASSVLLKAERYALTTYNYTNPTDFTTPSDFDLRKARQTNVTHPSETQDRHDDT